jgi:hypothetical protein
MIQEKKKAEIWIENKCTEIEYTSFTSELSEKAYFFMNGKENAAIVPWTFLIIFI